MKNWNENKVVNIHSTALTVEQTRSMLCQYSKRREKKSEMFSQDFIWMQENAKNQQMLEPLTWATNTQRFVKRFTLNIEKATQKI